MIVSCTQCKMPLPDHALNHGRFVPCTECGAPLIAEVFPALFRGQARGQEAEDVLDPGEAGCFHHPAKRAVVPCEACGRFLCALCDIELRGQHLCPSCLETGTTKGRLKTLQNHRSLHDNMTLAMAILPALAVWPTIASAPMTLYMAGRYWKAPTSLLPRTKIRFVIAILLASAQMIGWAAIIYYFMRN